MNYRYGPLTDVQTTEDDEEDVDGYGFANKNNNYYSENPKVGGGWYAEPPAHPSLSRPSSRHESTENRGPAMIVDLRKLGTLAAIKIALVKLTAIKTLKFLLFLAVKLKLIAVLAVFLAGKFFVLGQMMKLFLFPIVWSWIRNATNSAAQTGTSFGASSESINSSSSLSGAAFAKDATLETLPDRTRIF